MKREDSFGGKIRSAEFEANAACGGGAAPSRVKEEKEALQNLRKRVAPHHLLKYPKDDKPSSPRKSPHKSPAAELAKRLLDSIVRSRPLAVALEQSEVRTAWQDSDFITECLCWHNVYRQRHGAPPLTMAPELCGYAQTWANRLAHTDKFCYRNDRSVGQNLFQRPCNALQSDVTGQEVSSYWYSAVERYDYSKEPDVLHASVHATHFTQLVWASTRLFGVGKARSRAGKIVVVAHYSPPGNRSGCFELNVLPPAE